MAPAPARTLSLRPGSRRRGRTAEPWRVPGLSRSTRTPRDQVRASPPAQHPRPASAEGYPVLMAPEPLRDGHGRAIGDLRVSVTVRCNFRCQYCMPAEGLPWLERAAVLSFEEITRLVAVLASMGVHDVRLTGGEPLVRRGFPRLAGMLAALPGVHDLSLTTNGFLLERDAPALVQAGVDRFNVSLDSLQRDRFYALTRRDALPQVLRGLELLASFPEAHPTKINAGAHRGLTVGVDVP